MLVRKSPPLPCRSGAEEPLADSEKGGDSQAESTKRRAADLQGPTRNYCAPAGRRAPSSPDFHLRFGLGLVTILNFSQTITALGPLSRSRTALGSRSRTATALGRYPPLGPLSASDLGTTAMHTALGRALRLGPLSASDRYRPVNAAPLTCPSL